MRVKYKVFKHQVKMHLTTKEGAPWTKKLQHYALIAFLTSYVALIGVTEYQAHSKPIILENKPISWDVRKEAESSQPQEDSHDEVEAGDSGAGGVSMDDRIENRIRRLFPENPEVALAIAKAESKLNPNVVGDRQLEFVYEGKVMGHSCGIFQIRVLPGRPDCESLTNVETNLAYARKLYDKAGFQPWSAYTNGAYIKWLATK